MSRPCDYCRRKDPPQRVQTTHRLSCGPPGPDYSGGWAVCDGHLAFAIEDALGKLLHYPVDEYPTATVIVTRLSREPHWDMNRIAIFRRRRPAP